MLLIDDNNSTETDQDVLSTPKVNRNHHPMVLLSQKHIGGGINMNVACHDGKMLRKNMFKNEELDWVRSKRIDSMEIERQVHSIMQFFKAKDLLII